MWTRLATKTLCMMSLLWAMALKMAQSTGQLGTHGEQTGEKTDTLELSEALTTLALKATAPGLSLSTLGLIESSTSPPKKKKMIPKMIIRIATTLQLIKLTTSF